MESFLFKKASYPFIILSLLFYTTKGLIKIPPGQTIPAVIVFGDSIVDTGNNNYINTLIKCNFSPYGVNFFEGPTGRFSNGKVPSDLIAQELGIKGFVPAYLDPNLQPQDLITGVSFASGGTGYDPLTSKLASVISLDQQLEYFKEYISKLKEMVGEDTTNFILEKSLYLLVAGSDDIANTYFVLGARKEYDIPSYADLMATHASSFLQDLYNLGARRYAVFSAPPIGCVPSQRTLAGGIVRDCAQNYNVAAQLFNSKLIAELDTLNANLPSNRMIYIDVYSPLNDIIQNPSKYGFEVQTKGCCGTGDIEVSVLCNPLTPFTCANPSGYVFWDSYHPTEQTYRILISQLLPKYINRFF